MYDEHVYVLSEPACPFLFSVLLLSPCKIKSCSFLFSFHVGSGCYDASAYATAISAARSVFDLAVSRVRFVRT